MKRKVTIRNSSPSVNPAKGENTDPSFEIDPIEIGRTLLRRRKWFVGIVGTTVAVTITVMLFTANRYTSHAVILPSGGKSQNISALKAMAGLMTGGSMNDETSSAIFPVILRSHLIADSLLDHVYSFKNDGRDTSLTLREYIDRDDSDRLYRALAGMTSISSDKRTGEITVKAETEYPEFSRQLVSGYITQLENWNLHSRRSKASERVEYLSRELQTRMDSLIMAEDALGDFQERNRNWSATTDAFIFKQLGRLKRDVEIKTKTYAYLLQEFEIARLDAHKDIPIVRVLDKATLPTQKSGPYRSITVIASGLISFLVVAMVVFLMEMFQQGIRTSDRTKVETLRSELRQALPFARTGEIESSETPELAGRQ